MLIAASGYKESLSAEEVADAIEEGVRAALPEAEISKLPLVDGGEDTARTLAQITGGRWMERTVTGPIGEPVKTGFGLLGGEYEGVAAIDLASAAGLKLVPPDRRDPGRTTTRGVGELMAAALDTGMARLLIGCGDSGVNDAGAGLAEALGAKFLNKRGEPIAAGGLALADLARIDLSDLDPRLADVTIEVACNMTNVLTGADGVARVFGPQKGASPEDVERLAAALDRYADLVERETGCDVRLIPGGGASGGAGAGLKALLGAELRSRFDLLLPLFDLDGALGRADLVLTAEGGIDFKTARGKVPAEVGDRAARLGKPVIALAGTVGERAETVRAHGVCAYFSSVLGPETLQDAMDRAADELACLGENVMCAVLVGRRLADTRG